MRSDQESAIIIGIDPGTRITGYGIIQAVGNHYKAIDYGCIRPPAHLKLSERYHVIASALGEILDAYCPVALAIEHQFVGINVQSTLKLGMACGVAIVTAKQKGIKIYQYAPSSIKKAVVGRGRASKAQVQVMVQLLLSLEHPPEPADASDALAMAICHAHTRHFYDSSEMEI
jgi:crossover junction endodeoxyribonuclease RuvC